MEHSLLSVNQARHNNIAINDVHPSIDYYNKSTNDIFFPEMKKSIQISPTNKAISHVQVRYPTDDDLEDCNHLELTSSEDWSPSSEDWNQTTISYTTTEDINEDNNNYLHNKLVSKVQISAIHHTKYHKELTKETLADLWSICIKTAQRTLDATTQKHLKVRSGDLHRRFKTKSHQ